jgi:CBS domain-containing protein
MASNPRWCQPRATWLAYFERWLDHPAPEELLAASIYFDLRALHGRRDLAAPLEHCLRTRAPGARAFLRLLAHDVASRRVPRTLLGNVAVRRRGAARGTVDLKSAGVLQLTGAARVDALALGLAATNTIDRFRGAGERGVYTKAEVQEVTDACQHLMRLRLAHQLERLATGAPPDNRIEPARLSRADAVLLREALATVQRVQRGLRVRFATEGLG